MTRRNAIALALIFTLALLAYFPLRLAIGGLAERGFTARQVAGTIWYGRIGELMWRGQRLGTFEVRVDPFALLSGGVRLRLDRLAGGEPPLGLLLHAGASRGVSEVEGRLAAGRLFGRLPVTELIAQKVTARFAGDRCVEANGRLTAVVATPLPALDGAFSGPLACDGERLRGVLTGPAGAELEFYVRSSGRYRAWLRLPVRTAEMDAALAAAGVAVGPDGAFLTSEGQW